MNKSLAVTFSLIVVVLAVFVFVDPIPQDLNYHNFADVRAFFGVSNFWNVFSNLPFVVAGFWGFVSLRARRMLVLDELYVAYVIMFLGTAAVGLGSAFYHLEPNNLTLVWDRLPMTIAFMSLFAIVLAEFVAVDLGKRLLFALLVCGFLSVLFWHVSEFFGMGDLRPYALVQFLPLLFIPIILLSYKSCFSHAYAYWYTLGFYVAAKLFEHFDGLFFSALGFISGHSIKHLSAAVGMFFLIYFYRKRQYRDV